MNATFPKRLRPRVPIAAIAIAASLAACASAPSLDVATLPRIHAPHSSLPAVEFEPAIVFAGGSAWLLGSDAAVGAWVVGRPGPLWPEDVDAPALVVGRVAERGGSWARIETAAAVDGIREPALRAEVVAPHQLPPVTRRVVPVRVEGGQPVALAGSGALVSNTGLYGVLPQSLATNVRLGGGFAGVVRLIATDMESARIEVVRGAAPVDGDRLVFLGIDPGRSAAVRIAASGVDAPLIEAAIAARLDLDSIPAVSFDASSVGSLGDALVVDVLAADGYAITAQDARVAVGAGATLTERALRTVPMTTSDTALAATAAVARVHSLRGEFVLAAWALEAELRAQPTPDAWIALGPLLAAAWRDAWRRDLAFEVALQLEALAERGGLAGRRLTEARGAAVAAGLVAGADAMVATQAALVDPNAEVSAAGQVAFAAQALRARHWNDAARWTRRLGTDGVEGWLRAQLTASRWWAQGERLPDDLWVQADALSATLGPLFEDEVATWRAIEAVRASGLVATDTLALVDTLDARGAPGLGYGLAIALAAAVGGGGGGQDLMVEQLMLQAAAFAWASRRPLVMARVLVELDFDRLEATGTSPVVGDLLARYLETLAAGDLRVWLGRRALVNAQLTPERTTQRETLQLARGLFHSIGDPLNTAIAELRLAQLELDDGRIEVARAWVDSAARYEPAARDAALSALRQRLEKSVDAPLPDPGSDVEETESAPSEAAAP